MKLISDQRAILLPDPNIDYSSKKEYKLLYPLSKFHQRNFILQEKFLYLKSSNFGDNILVDPEDNNSANICVLVKNFHNNKLIMNYYQITNWYGRIHRKCISDSVDSFNDIEQSYNINRIYREGKYEDGK